MIQRLCYRFLFIGALLTAQIAVAEDDDCQDSPSIKVTVTNSGLYRIPVKDLQALFGCTYSSPDRLQLSNQGDIVPFSVLNEKQADHGDLLFFARHLQGSDSYYNEFSQYNTYWLDVVEPSSVQAVSPSQDNFSSDASVVNAWARLEKDELRVRFKGRADAPQPEVWYWARLNSIDPEPYVIPLDFQQRLAGTRPGIRVGLRGWSKPQRQKFPDMAHHRVEVLLNDQLIGSGEWQDQEEFIIEIPEIPGGILKDDGTDQLSLRVPQRIPLDGGPALVDAILLNWLELNYQHQGVLSVGQHYLRVMHGDGDWFQLAGPDEVPPVLVDDRGQRLQPIKSYQSGQHYWHRYATQKDISAYVAVVGDAYHQPVSMVADAPSNLLNTSQQADYLILTHPSLSQSVEALATFHRQKGLSVQVIDINDVYDEFNYGVLAPAAIRDFISHAYHNWQSPKPRFVLLVGDASWDVHSDVGKDRNYADWTFRQNEKKKFAKNSSNEYSDNLTSADRNLIPTWPVETYEGYAASDNVFVAVDGDDYLPDLAIGRFPVSNPADVTAIVDKTIAYHQQSEVGPWRSKVLWITNEQTGLQRTTDRLDISMAQTGFAGTKVYPSPDEEDNIAHQAVLQSAFDDGQLLVHFMGHGGRYVWRTGPPDPRKNHDLFTLDHLEELTPTARLPFVMSMTCYSAPFDHPTADSIGEKFLRMPDRGAIGILAASWRNTPSRAFSQAMLDELTKPGTMGEAVMRAKQGQKNRLMIETYNLLGDPAAQLALPQYKIELEVVKKNSSLQLVGKLVDKSFSGQVMIDWQDADSELIQSKQVKFRRGKFKLRIDDNPDQEIAKISAYAWNQRKNIDAMGGIAFESKEDVARAAQRAARLEARRKKQQ